MIVYQQKQGCTKKNIVFHIFKLNNLSQYAVTVEHIVISSICFEMCIYLLISRC